MENEKSTPKFLDKEYILNAIRKDTEDFEAFSQELSKDKETVKEFLTRNNELSAKYEAAYKSYKDNTYNSEELIQTLFMLILSYETLEIDLVKHFKEELNLNCKIAKVQGRSEVFQELYGDVK